MLPRTCDPLLPASRAAGIIVSCHHTDFSGVVTHRQDLVIKLRRANTTVTIAVVL